MTEAKTMHPLFKVLLLVGGVVALFFVLLLGFALKDSANRTSDDELRVHRARNLETLSSATPSDLSLTGVARRAQELSANTGGRWTRQLANDLQMWWFTNGVEDEVVEWTITPVFVSSEPDHLSMSTGITDEGVTVDVSLLNPNIINKNWPEVQTGRPLRIRGVVFEVTGHLIKIDPAILVSQ